MEYEYWMASLFKIDCGKRIQACQLTGSAEQIYKLSAKQLKELYVFSEEEINYIVESRKSFDLKEEWKTFLKKDINFVPYSHDRYPEKLLHIYQPPYALYVKGELPENKKKSVAIVGARMCSEYGRSIAKKLGELLAEHQVQVISGMALGIDSASHAGALSAKGKTFAVLGCGCDICYPRSSGNIYQNIQKSGGGIISELAPGVQPLPHFFPLRNRIISALSDIVVVVEAKERSGSLITADFALEQGKDIYAVPGRYMDQLSQGCNHLIEQGAGILYNFENFLKNTGIVSEKKKKLKKSDEILLEKEEMMVYSCLDLHPKFINLIIEETGLNLLTVLSTLDTLRKKKLIQETFQNYFCKKL